MGSIPITGTTFTTAMKFVATIGPNPFPYGKVERNRETVTGLGEAPDSSGKK